MLLKGYIQQTFLGVIIDSNLHWKEHIKRVKSKMVKSIAILYDQRHVRSGIYEITI